MPANVLRENDEIVRTLQGAINEGEHGLKVVPALLKRVIRENRWQERHVEVLGRDASFVEFSRFVESTPPEGLGATVLLLKRISGGDAEALDLIDCALGSRQGERTDFFDNVQEVNEAPTGNAAQTAIRRLRKDRPDIHARVIAGELSPHAGMIEAGFRPKTATVRLDDPASAIRTLLKHFTADAIRTALDQEGGPP